MAVARVDVGKMDESSLRALRDMVGQIAHDLNNMLIPLVAYPEMIREEIESGSKADADIEAMEKAVSAIRDFCDRLLLFSGRSAAQQSPVDLCSVVAGAVDSFRMESKTPGLDIECRAQPGAVPVVACETTLETAIHELCRNAEAAMPGGGRLVVATDSVVEREERRSLCGGRVLPGLYARIIVSDMGPGIPHELRWSALNPFVTGVGGAGKKRGAGMGLTLACAIARDHGGYLGIECPGGSGTVVTIGIPVKTPEGAAR